MDNEAGADLAVFKAILDAGNEQIRQTFNLYLEMLREFQQMKGGKKDEQQSG